MVRGVGYHLRLLAYRQTAIAPLLVFLGLLAAVYASPAGPPISAGAVPAVALMPVTAWLARSAATVESSPYAEMTQVALGGRRHLHLARAAAALAVAAALTVVSVVWGLLADDPSPHTLRAVVVIAGMCLAQAIAGAAVGLLLGPPVRPGTTALATTGAVIISLLVPWLPPLNPLLRVAERTTVAPAGTLFLAVVQAAIFGVLLLVVASARSR